MSVCMCACFIYVCISRYVYECINGLTVFVFHFDTFGLPYVIIKIELD